MAIIEIRYCFKFDKTKVEYFNLRLDPRKLELIHKPNQNYPDWAKLEFRQCSHCSLDIGNHPNCPVAVSLYNIIERFNHVFSYDKIDLEVIMNERKISQRTTVQEGMSSLLGILFATSGCPHTNFLKPMARFHLPLATVEETIFRVISMYLLGQCFLQKEGKNSDFMLEGLKQKYNNLQLINIKIAERIRSVVQTDSSVNAICSLDIFANSIMFLMEDNLDDIRCLYDSYFSSYDK